MFFKDHIHVKIRILKDKEKSRKYSTSTTFHKFIAKIKISTFITKKLTKNKTRFVRKLKKLYIIQRSSRN